MSNSLKLGFSRGACATRRDTNCFWGAHLAPWACHRAASRHRVGVQAIPELDALQGMNVYGVESGTPSDIVSLSPQLPADPCILVFFTHWGDLGSWEYAQRLVEALPKIEAAGIKLITVGLGSVGGGREFSRCTGFPLEKLYADTSGDCYTALGFNPGFARDTDISPYIKLLTMLLGVGSPGTIQEVLRGYFGDKNEKPVFKGSSPFDILGTGYQRPFELATLRLRNMVEILPKWDVLCPPDENLLIQQGGTLAFKGEELLFKHKDSGILKTANVADLLASTTTAQIAA